MYTLYIDTHYVNLVIGLLIEDKLKLKREIESESHSKNTICLLKEVMEETNVRIDDLKEIIVINGPGSFTGVRIGIVIAKILGYTKDIPIKSLSYLEAMALNFDSEVTVGVKDRNGAFVASFDNNHVLMKDYVYLNNKDLNEKNNIVFDTVVDLEKISSYMKDKDVVNPHLLKPLYVKKIEVEK